MPIILEDVSTDTISDPVRLAGGSAIVSIRASDFGGSTVEVQAASLNDSLQRFATLPNGTFTSDTSVKLDYGAVGLFIRVVVSGTSAQSEGIFTDILQ